MPDRNRVALEWAMTLRQPLIPTIRKAVANEAMVKLCEEDESWALWWLAGQVADHVLTLPAEDPWRGLSARAGHLTRGLAPPVHMGAEGAYGSFGTVADGADLVAPIGAPDGDLVTLESGLMPASSVLLAFAADGHDAVADAWVATRGGGQVGLYSALGEALVWSMWRRRVYVGMEDPLDEVSATGWLWRADVLCGGQPLGAAEEHQITVERGMEKIPDGRYAQLADL